MHFVVEGTVEAVSRDGHVCYRADTGGFVGEASLAHAVSGTLPDYDSLGVPGAAVRGVGAENCVARAASGSGVAARRGLLDAFREALALDFRARRPLSHASMASRRGVSARTPSTRRERRGDISTRRPS